MVSRIRRDDAPRIQKPKPPKPEEKPKPRAARVAARDELSTGRGTALRNRGLATTGAALRAKASLADVLASRRASASSLRTEVRGDGQANCLERAVDLAQPGDRIVLLTDREDPVGHAVVQRANGEVVDPNRPDNPYASLTAFTAANPRYGNPATVTDQQAEQLLSTPPGARRDRLIRELGLENVAARAVADGATSSTNDPAAAARAVEATYEETLEETDDPVAAANAAAQQLESLTAGRDEEYVAELTAAARPTIDRIAETVGQAARDDLDRDKDVMKDTMAHLANVAERGGAQQLAASLAEQLPNDDELEEIDDALFEQIEQGGQTDLARALDTELRRIGKHDAARGLADNEHGTDLEELVVAEARNLLDAGTEEAREQIVEQYLPYLTEHIGRAVGAGDGEATEVAVELLADLADQGGPEMSETIARSLAEAVPNQSDLVKLDDKLHSLAEDGRGVTLAVDLVEELSEAGKLDAANELTDVVTTGIDALRSDYEDAQSRVDELNEELAYMVGNFEGLLTPEQKQAAIADFHERHAEEYEALERAAERFGQNVDAIAAVLDPDSPISAMGGDNLADLRESAHRAFINVLPRIAETAAGGQMVAEALEAQGRGEDTWLDAATGIELSDEQVREYASDDIEALGINDLLSLNHTMAGTLFSGATLGLLGDTTNHDDLVRGLERYAGRLGIDPELVSQINADVRALGALGENPDPAEVRRLQDRIRANTDELEALDPNSRAGQAFRGFATVLGAVNAINGLSDFGDATLEERIGTIAGTLETGLGAYELVLGATGNAAKIPGFVGPAGAVLGGVSAVLSGIAATEAFRNGDWVSGTGHSLTAVGSGILAVAAASNVVPVWGQVTAGVLLAVGLGLNQWASVQESNKWEGPSEDFLRGAGISQKLAEELSNHGGDGFSAGPAIVALADYLDISGPELLRHLETLSESQLQNFIERGVHKLELEGEGADARFPETGEDAERMREFIENGPAGLRTPEPDSLQGLALWMQHFGYLPPGVTVPAV